MYNNASFNDELITALLNIKPTYMQIMIILQDAALKIKIY